MAAHTSESHADYNSLTAASAKMKEIATFINAEKGKFENLQKITEVLKFLGETKVEGLFSVCACTHTYTRTRTHASIHTRVLGTCIHTYIHTHACTCTHARARTHVHAHTYTLASCILAHTKKLL